MSLPPTQPAFSSFPKHKRSSQPPAWGSDSGLWANQEGQARPLMGPPTCPPPLFDMCPLRATSTQGQGRPEQPGQGSQGGELTLWGEGVRVVSQRGGDGVGPQHMLSQGISKGSMGWDGPGAHNHPNTNISPEITSLHSIWGNQSLPCDVTPSCLPLPALLESSGSKRLRWLAHLLFWGASPLLSTRLNRNPLLGLRRSQAPGNGRGRTPSSSSIAPSS